MPSGPRPTLDAVPAERLALLSLHQRTASIDARERLTSIAQAAPRRADVIALLTCHRVEIYAAIAGDEDPRATVGERMGTADAVLGETTVLQGRDAALHLIQVATGLDSAIVGEGQIGRQIRRAYDGARGGGLDAILASLFQRALHLAREIRATSELGLVRRSIGSLAVDEALRHVADPTRATALVVGAGEIGKLAARALAKRVGRLVIANRDNARAIELAAVVGADGIGLEALAGALDRTDAVISAADTRGALLTRELLAPRAAQRPLVLVDIALPRSVPEDARDLPGLTYRDVDDLATESSAVPPGTIAVAQGRCAAEADAFVRWLVERGSAPTIRAVRERADAIRERQLARAMRRLGHLTDRDREVVEALSRGLTQALLHEPTVRLRGRPDRERAARALFGLDEKRP
jgi:glutamyl-tRNA reductase